MRGGRHLSGQAPPSTQTSQRNMPVTSSGTQHFTGERSSTFSSDRSPASSLGALPGLGGISETTPSYTGSFVVSNNDPEQPGKILCVADIRGNIARFNELARLHQAQVIIHVGDFGFLDESSLDEIQELTLRWKVQHSPLLRPQEREYLSRIPDLISLKKALSHMPYPCLSMFPKLVNSELRLDVPVYTIYGFCEDVHVLEKLRRKQYDIPNLHVIDEANAGLIELGSLRLRLLGLGGPFIPNKLLDHGSANSTIAGTTGQTWITLLQIGELLQTAGRLWHSSETRILLTQASPGRDSALLALAGTLQCDFTVSGGLHFRYGSIHNEASVSADVRDMRSKCERSAAIIDASYNVVRHEIEAQASPRQRELLESALSAVRLPSTDNTRLESGAELRSSEETIYRNIWHVNLPDEGIGSSTLIASDGRLTLDTHSSGTAFVYRRGLPVSGSAFPPSVPAQLPPQQRTPQQRPDHDTFNESSAASLRSVNRLARDTHKPNSGNEILKETGSRQGTSLSSSKMPIGEGGRYGEVNGRGRVSPSVTQQAAENKAQPRIPTSTTSHRYSGGLPLASDKTTVARSMDSPIAGSPSIGQRHDDKTKSSMPNDSSKVVTESNSFQNQIARGLSSDGRRSSISAASHSPSLGDSHDTAGNAHTRPSSSLRTVKINGLPEPEKDAKMQLLEIYGLNVGDKIQSSRRNRKVPGQFYADVKEEDLAQILALHQKSSPKLERGLEVTVDNHPMRSFSATRARASNAFRKSRGRGTMAVAGSHSGAAESQTKSPTTSKIANSEKQDVPKVAEGSSEKANTPASTGQARPQETADAKNKANKTGVHKKKPRGGGPRSDSTADLKSVVSQNKE